MQILIKSLYNRQFCIGIQSWDRKGEIEIERKRVWEGNQKENSTAKAEVCNKL